MGDVARCSIENEDLLYNLFGVNAELLIDHSWGWECATIKSIKEYKPQNNSLSSGQVLHEPYNYEKSKLIVKEMTDVLILELVEKHLLTDQIVLTIGYDTTNLTNSEISKLYNGEITKDHYGRNIPKHAHGTINLANKTSSTKIIMEATVKLFDEIINKNLFVRRINVTANKVIHESDLKEKKEFEQIDLFTNYEELEKKNEIQKELEQKEKNLQHAVIDIKNKFGKNAILKGMNFEEGGTMRDRNKQIGGHKQ